MSIIGRRVGKAAGRSGAGKMEKKKRPAKITIPKNLADKTDAELDALIKEIRSKPASTKGTLEARKAMEKLKEAKAKARADKKKPKTKASTQRGIVGAGARSAPGKGAKNPRAKDAEPMREASDAKIADEAVAKGQLGKITAASDLPAYKALQTKAQKDRVKKYVDLMIKKRKAKEEGGPPLTDAEKRWLKSDARYEAQRLIRAGQGTGNRRKEAPKATTDSAKGRTPGGSKKKKTKAEALALEPIQPKRTRADDMGDPETGEFTGRTTRERLDALARNAEVRQRIARDRRREAASRRRNLGRYSGGAITKPKMAYGGMANKKQHMYVAGGSVTDNPGLRALRKSGPKGREAYANIVKNVKSKRS
jgi:hypothetical protein